MGWQNVRADVVVDAEARDFAADGEDCSRCVRAWDDGERQRERVCALKRWIRSLGGD
jgi:hypothetical protein